MKIENQKIATKCWVGIAARGPTQLAWPCGTMAQAAHASRALRALGAVTAQWPHARQARLRRWPRCSAPGGDSTDEQRQLCRARWGGGVLTGDDQRRWEGENGPARRRSKAAVELWWSGRTSTNPTAGGGDGGGGQAWSKRGGRWGHDKAHRGGNNEAMA
jgi:hypothetical protein